MIKTKERARIILFLTAAIVLVVGIAAFVFLRTFDLGYYPDARDYVIFDGEKVITLVDCIGTADDALERARINIGNADIVVTEEEDATVINVNRYPSVTVLCDGEETLVAMKNATVGDVIEKLGIELNDADTLNYSEEQTLKDGMRIKVGRITLNERSVEEEVPYETVYENEATLEKGKTQLKTEGKNGVLTTTYKYTYENGLLVGFELVSKEVTTEPVNEVWLVGTKEPPKPVTKPSNSSGGKNSGSSSSTGKSTSSNPSISTSGTGSSSSKDGVHSVTAKIDTENNTITAADGTVYTYSKVISMRATAYTYDSNPAMNITSSGVPVQVGVVAALPRTLPQGTKVYIVGESGTWEYGFATVGDKPGIDIVDLFMETEKQCINFGVRNAKVYIVG